jgi:tRNA pseudouridine13 synthase
MTSQWFSVQLPEGREPGWERLESDQVRVLAVTRHRRKLRRGALKENRFVLRVRDVQGDLAELERRLEGIRERGVPSYFGEQRFGRDENNLVQAGAMLSGALRVRDRYRRGLYLSAARSWLFNRVLSQRVQLGVWDLALPGDLMMLDGSHSVFRAEDIDDEIRERVRLMDIHPTGPLWGKGESPASLACRQIEEAVLEELGSWRTGLAHAGLEQERRALRLKVDGLEWTFQADGSLELRFRLPAGSYATAVLREICRYRMVDTKSD